MNVATPQMNRKIDCRRPMVACGTFVSQVHNKQPIVHLTSVAPAPDVIKECGNWHSHVQWLAVGDLGCSYE